VFQLGVDMYLDQPACSGRAHWNKSNEVLDTNTRSVCGGQFMYVHVFV